MSIINKTTNLGLTQFTGSLTAFANLYSRYNADMLILDEHVGGYEASINTRMDTLETLVNSYETRVETLETCCSDVNTTLLNYGSRLVEIERVIDTVSTANVDDLTERVNALENKVQVNADNIDIVKIDLGDLKDRVSTLESKEVDDARQIASNTGRIITLELCCEEVKTTLSGYDARISKNSDDIAELIARVEHDELNISANAQDITILSTQVRANTSDIEDLKNAFDELDPTSQFELVRQVTINTEAISNLQSIVGSQTTAINNLNTRMDTVESEMASMELRVQDCERAAEEITTYNQRISEMETIVDQCNDNVTRLTSDVEDLTTLVGSYETRVSTNESDISDLKTRCTNIESTIASDEGALNALSARVTVNETDIDNLQSDLTALTGRVTVNEGNISNLQTLCGDGNLNTIATDLTGGVNEVNTLVNNADSKATQALEYIGNWTSTHTSETITDVIDNMASAIKDALHPVGSVYLTIGNTDPATLLGFGTWSLLSDGYLRNGGTNASGGSLTSGNHVLTNDEMPNHTHSLSNHTHSLSNHTHSGTTNSGLSSYPTANFTATSGTISINECGQLNASGRSLSHTHSFTTGTPSNNTSGTPSNNTSGASGGGLGHTHSIEPTFTRVYAWERTA